MSVFVSGENIVFDEPVDVKNEILSDLSSHINKDGEPPTANMEQEKRIRREIANSNERRRMQSINNGFQSLRSLLPHHEGEKLSKAAILQQTAEYIYNLEQEKTRLLSQNCQLKRLVNQHEGGELPPKKRKTEMILPKLATETSEDGIRAMSPEPVGMITVSVNSTAQPESTEFKRQLDRERKLRHILEDQVRQLENQLFQMQSTTQATVYQVEEDDIALQLVTPESLPPVAHTQTVMCSPSRSRTASPEPDDIELEAQRLPTVLEAAIKAEPKVEVERLPSPNPSSNEVERVESNGGGRVYASNRSRQNLETIVEAIRHLEGDHMFDEPQQEVQEVPLALTKRREEAIQCEMNTFLEFHSPLQQHQQSRPGVIVVKQCS